MTHRARLESYVCWCRALAHRADPRIAEHLEKLGTALRLAADAIAVRWRWHYEYLGLVHIRCIVLELIRRETPQAEELLATFPHQSLVRELRAT